MVSGERHAARKENREQPSYAATEKKRRSGRRVPVASPLLVPPFLTPVDFFILVVLSARCSRAPSTTPRRTTRRSSKDARAQENYFSSRMPLWRNFRNSVHGNDTAAEERRATRRPRTRWCARCLWASGVVRRSFFWPEEAAARAPCPPLERGASFRGRGRAVVFESSPVIPVGMHYGERDLTRTISARLLFGSRDA